MSLVHMYSGPELKNLTGAITAETVKSLWGKDTQEQVTLDFREHVFYALVMTDDNTLVGLARLVSVETKDKRYMIVHNVLIDEHYRGQGFGKALTQTIIDFGKEKNLHFLELTSNPERQVANTMYHKSGFTLLAQSVDTNGTNLYRYFFT